MSEARKQEPQSVVKFKQYDQTQNAVKPNYFSLSSSIQES